MERIDRKTWNRHFRPRDKSALMLVLAITIAIVAILSFVLF